MRFIDLLNHIANFALPAFAVGLLVAALAPVLLRTPRPKRRWWVQGLRNSLAGLLALVVGLVLFGNDGKMLTWAMMVVLIAISQYPRA